MYGDQRLPEIKVQTVKCLSNTEHSLVLLERSCDTLPEQRDAGEYSSQHQKGKFFIQYVLKLRIKPNPRPARESSQRKDVQKEQYHWERYGCSFRKQRQGVDGNRLRFRYASSRTDELARHRWHQNAINSA